MGADDVHDMAVVCDKLYIGSNLTEWHVKGSPSQQEILQRSWQQLTTQKGEMQKKSQWKGNRRVLSPSSTVGDLCVRELGKAAVA